jgi:hypothetical protein
MHFQALAAGELFNIDMHGRCQLHFCPRFFVILSQEMLWPHRLRSIHLHGAHLVALFRTNLSRHTDVFGQVQQWRSRVRPQQAFVRSASQRARSAFNLLVV